MWGFWTTAVQPVHEESLHLKRIYLPVAHRECQRDMAPVWVSPCPGDALDRPDLNPSPRAHQLLSKFEAYPISEDAGSTSCEIPDTSHEGFWHPHEAASAAAVDPELKGRCILLVLPGGKSRHRLMSSMKAAGCRLVCYAPAISPWATAFVAAPHDWILGPIGDHGAALSKVKAWLHAEAALSCGCPPKAGSSCSQSSGELGHDDDDGEAVCGAGREVAFDGVLSYDEYGIQLAAHLAQVRPRPRI